MSSTSNIGYFIHADCASCRSVTELGIASGNYQFNPTCGIHGPLVRYNDFGEPMKYETKDSGQRQSFESGMVRDLATDKLGWHRISEGPMLRRWAELLSRGATKYPDIAPGKANWTLANSAAELQRGKESAFRHFMEWYYNDNPTEDAAAGVLFNINLVEYIKERLKVEKQPDLRQG